MPSPTTVANPVSVGSKVMQVSWDDLLASFTGGRRLRREEIRASFEVVQLERESELDLENQSVKRNYTATILALPVDGDRPIKIRCNYVFRFPQEPNTLEVPAAEFAKLGN